MALTEKELQKLSPEERAEYLELVKNDKPAYPEVSDFVSPETALGALSTFSDPKKMLEDLPQLVADMGVSAAADLTWNSLDNLLGAMYASYKHVKDGEDWNAAYTSVQKPIEDFVAKARKRHPGETFAAGFLTPAGPGKLGALMKEVPVIEKMMKMADKPGMKTAFHTFMQVYGSQPGEKAIDEKAWEAAKYSIMFGLPEAAVNLGRNILIGSKQSVVHQKLGTSAKTIEKYADKFKNKGYTVKEAGEELADNLWNTGIFKNKDQVFDVVSGQYKTIKPKNFIQKALGVFKAPSSSETQKLLQEGEGKLGQRITEILKTTKDKTPQEFQQFATDLKNDLTQSLGSGYHGSQKAKAIKQVNEIEKILNDIQVEPKYTGMNFAEKLNEAKKQVYNMTSFGAKDPSAKQNLINEALTTIGGKVKERIGETITNPRLKEEWEKHNSLYEDMATSMKGIKSKQAKEFEPVGIPTLTKASSGREALEVIRGGVGVPTYKFLEGKEKIPLGLGQDIFPKVGKAIGRQSVEEEYSPEDTTSAYDIPYAQLQGRGTQAVNPGEEIVNETLPDPREMKIAQLKEEKQKAALEKLRLSKLSRNSDEFVAQKELALAKFAQQAPEELANISHILTSEPDKIEDAVTLYSTQYPELFTSDVYKRVNGKIIDNNAKSQARKDTTNREDLSNTEKANILNRLNKTGQFDADKKPVIEAPKKAVDLSKTYQELGSMKTKNPAGEVISETVMPQIDVPAVR